MAEEPTLQDSEASKAENGHPVKRERKRHKKIYTDLVRQMDFYFSDANVAKSQFMKERLSKGPWIDLEVFMKFNKITGMLTQFFGEADINKLKKAIASIPSEIIELSEDGTKIKKKNPLVAKENTDECTIYVENLAPHDTIDSLQQQFSKFGPVAYVSLPRFKPSGAIKGFAFVEFQEEESAMKALDSYNAEGNAIEPASKDPGELRSIKAFQEEETRKLTEDDDDKNKEEDEQEEDEKEGKDEEPAAKKAKMEDKEEEKKKKKRRKRHKKDHQDEQEVHDLQVMSWQIMSKRSWKSLRNSYLNKQKENMRLAKRRLWEEFRPKQQRYPKVIPTAEKQVEQRKSVVPNSIVRFRVSDPIDDTQLLKQRIKAAFTDPVAYVDAGVGAQEFFVRCTTAEHAQKLAGVKALGHEAVVLKGEEEKAYLEKLERDRMEKKQGKVKTMRGKDKVVKKFEDMQGKNTHVFFD